MLAVSSSAALQHQQAEVDKSQQSAVKERSDLMGLVFADSIHENLLRSGLLQFVDTSEMMTHWSAAHFSSCDLKLGFILQKERRKLDMAAWQSSVSHSN